MDARDKEIKRKSGSSLKGLKGQSNRVRQARLALLVSPEPSPLCSRVRGGGSIASRKTPLVLIEVHGSITVVVSISHLPIGLRDSHPFSDKFSS